jgi:outer membrane protein
LLPPYLRLAAAQQLEIAQKSFEVGTVTITDVHEAQARFDLASAQQIAAENDLLVKREALSRIIGKPAESLASLQKGVALQRPQPDAVGEWVAAAEGQSLAVQGQQIGLEIASREVDRARAGHYPTVDLVASYGHTSSLSSSFAAGAAKLDGSTIGVQVNL